MGHDQPPGSLLTAHLSATCAALRPDEPVAVERWDEVAGLAAAYRETYNVTNNTSDLPLGPEPGGASTRADARQTVTEK